MGRALDLTLLAEELNKFNNDFYSCVDVKKVTWGNNEKHFMVEFLNKHTNEINTLNHKSWQVVKKQYIKHITYMTNFYKNIKNCK